MGAWTLARGKAAEQTLGDVVTQGATQIALTGADGIFALGEVLFISEADGTETEFLGAVTGVSPTAVDFAFPVITSKNSSGRLWRPQDRLSVHAEVASPGLSRVSTGVVVERSLGGDVYAIRGAEPSTAIEWRLKNLTDGEAEDLAAWLRDATDSGLLGFTLVAPSRRIHAVQVSGDAYTFESRAGGRNSLTVGLMLVGEGEYR